LDTIGVSWRTTGGTPADASAEEGVWPDCCGLATVPASAVAILVRPPAADNGALGSAINNPANTAVVSMTMEIFSTATTFFRPLRDSPF
jgi:hypothetical protein